MIRFAVIGEIGSGKSYVAKQFGHPVFNADLEVAKIYKKDKKCYIKLKKAVPKHILSFPINKMEITKSILSNQKNLKKIIKIVHPIVQLKMNNFIKKNKNKRIIILDVPLLLESKIDKIIDILVFVEAKKEKIIKNLKKRKNYNIQIIRILKKLQLPLNYKKKKSDFIIKNNFRENFVKKNIKLLKNKILNV